jgi:hypothetical protein
MLDGARSVLSGFRQSVEDCSERVTVEIADTRLSQQPFHDRNLPSGTVLHSLPSDDPPLRVDFVPRQQALTLPSRRVGRQAPIGRAIEAFMAYTAAGLETVRERLKAQLLRFVPRKRMLVDCCPLNSDREIDHGPLLKMLEGRI